MFLYVSVVLFISFFELCNLKRSSVLFSFSRGCGCVFCLVGGGSGAEGELKSCLPSAPSPSKARRVRNRVRHGKVFFLLPPSAPLRGWWMVVSLTGSEPWQRVVRLEDVTILLQLKY